MLSWPERRNRRLPNHCSRDGHDGAGEWLKQSEKIARIAFRPSKIECAFHAGSTIATKLTSVNHVVSGSAHEDNPSFEILTDLNPDYRTDQALKSDVLILEALTATKSTTAAIFVNP